MTFSNTTFLGGTCSTSTWRAQLSTKLNSNVETFNPVVPDWTPECQELEDKARAESRYVLFVLTKEMVGVYSVAEVVDCSNKSPERTLFCFIQEDFEGHMLKSLKATAKMVEANGAHVFKNIDEIAEFLNGQY